MEGMVKEDKRKSEEARKKASERLKKMWAEGRIHGRKKKVSMVCSKLEDRQVTNTTEQVQQ